MTLPLPMRCCKHAGTDGARASFPLRILSRLVVCSKDTRFVLQLHGEVKASALPFPTNSACINVSHYCQQHREGMYKSLNVLPLECGGVKSVFVAILAEVHSLQGLKIAAVEALVRILNSIACPVCAALSAWRLSKRCATSTRQDGCIGVAFRSPLHHA